MKSIKKSYTEVLSLGIIGIILALVFTLKTTTGYCTILTNNIITKMPDGQISTGRTWGNGFAISRMDGKTYIITCEHVVNIKNVVPSETVSTEITPLGLSFNTKKWTNFDFTVISTDPINDLALLTTNSETDKIFDLVNDSGAGVGTKICVEFDMLPGSPACAQIGEITSEKFRFPDDPCVYRELSVYVASGMSGSPVCLPGTNKVVGMIVGTWWPKGSGLMVPSSTILEWLSK